MAVLDWLIILAYLAIVFGLAGWVFKRRKDTPDDYFLANRNLGWFIVGASIFASNIGSEHLVGLAGSGATDGVAMAHYELHAWCLLVLAWVFVPFFMRSRVYTMPEFLEKRFSPGARWVLTVISLVGYVLTKIAVGIFAGGIVFGALLPDLQLVIFGTVWNSFWIGSVTVIILTGIYTVAGGMGAVAYTEALQTFVLVIGSGLLTFFGLQHLGGWEGFRAALDPDMFNLWKPLIPSGVEGTWAPVMEEGRLAWYFNQNYPWLGMLFCAPIIGLWYWCTDQYIVQRALGARDEQQARRGSIFAGILKLLPVFIFIIPGMIALALARTGEFSGLNAMVDAQGNAITEMSQAAYPLLVTSILPVGVRGIVVAGLLAALMSSLAGVFNASSTLFTMDLYQKFRPGAFRLAVDTPIALHLKGFEGGYAQGSFLWIVNSIYFQYYSLFIFLASVVAMVGVSYATAEPSYERISGLTFATVTDEHRATSRASWDRRDVLGSAAVLVMILMAYLYFRG